MTALAATPTSVQAGLVGILVAAAIVSWPRAARHRLDRPRHVRRGRPESRPAPPAGRPGLSVAMVMLLVASALEAGLPADVAVEAAARAAGQGGWQQVEAAVRLWRLGEAPDTAWAHVDERWRPLARCLVLSDRTGVPTATLLRAAAADVRGERLRTARVAAHRLGVRLVVPLGLTTLPAFLLCAVVPVVLGLARSLVSGG